MARTRYRFSKDQRPHFMTNTIVAWLPVFAYPDYVNIVLDSWRFLQREREIVILSWVVLENHLHWIATGPDLSKRVGEFKSFTAKQIIRKMEANGAKTLLQELEYYKLRHKVDQTHQVWQEGSHPKVIETDDVMWQKIEYCHNNPLRRGYVDQPEHWRYSSARNYLGQPGLIEVCVRTGAKYSSLSFRGSSPGTHCTRGSSLASRFELAGAKPKAGGWSLRTMRQLPCT